MRVQNTDHLLQSGHISQMINIQALDPSTTFKMLIFLGKTNECMPRQSSGVACRTNS